MGMRRKKRKPSWSGAACTILAGGLAAAILILGLRTAGRLCGEQALCQSVVSLEGMEPGENFEEELGKLSGFCSLTPVIEIPVKLRAEEYAMEVTWTGASLETLEKKVSRSREVPLGRTPVLLLGEGSLAAMTDRNGHGISEEKQREFLERYGEIQWQYCLSGEEGVKADWRPCLVAGTLSSPAEGIYLPYGQAETLAGTKETKQFLLTVRGTENYERALRSFEGGAGERTAAGSESRK